MSMSHDEMIAVITHHKNGGEVEFIRPNGTWAKVAGNAPSWDFQRETYRIKPEPMTLWLEISDGKVVVTHHEKPLSQMWPRTTLKKFVEVKE